MDGGPAMDLLLIPIDALFLFGGEEEEEEGGGNEGGSVLELAVLEKRFGLRGEGCGWNC